jgi:hypothetical protein
MEGAMPPLPKHKPARRNRSAGAATLRKPTGRAKVPALPERLAVPWHPQTLEWWADVWASPMAPEYDPSDVHGLYVLAMLVDAFWYEPSQGMAAEIRLQRQCFGLSPIDRRRLQWEIERADEAQARGAGRRAAAGQAGKKPPPDPRRTLHAV